jgi:hypothetical protein
MNRHVRTVDEAAKTIEWWQEKFETVKPANAVNCASIVSEALWATPGPRNRGFEADTIANAMLAFKRIGEEGQTIYVDSEWVIPFVKFLIEQQLKYRLRSEKDEKCEIIFPPGFNLREDLPAHLRGKFSSTP